MALTKCTECGQDISSSAKACPGCGAPTPAYEMEKSTITGVIAVWLGVAAIIMPYFAEVFLVPLTFIMGMVAITKGKKKMGMLAIFLALLGTLNIFYVSSKISDANQELKRSLDAFSNLK